jgi:hypothetical protein
VSDRIETPEEVLIRGRRAAFADQRRARIERQYRDVHAADPEEYRRCIQAADSIMINASASLIALSDAERSALGANIESAIIDVAHRHLTSRSRP